MKRGPNIILKKEAREPLVAEDYMLAFEMISKLGKP